MSVAVDTSRPENLDFSQSLGRQSGIELTSAFRAGIRAICSSGDETVVLQQLILMSGSDETWVRASATYIGNPLSIPHRTVADCLDRLAAKGFIESEQRAPGEAKYHRVRSGPILEAMQDADFHADRESLFGHPGGDSEPPSRDPQPPSRNPQPPPSRNPRQEEQSKQKEEYKDLEADGRAREAEAVDELDEQTAPAPNNPTGRHIWKTFKAWRISKPEAERIRQTLEALGLSDEMIRQYVSERAADFASRSRQISRAEVIRYSTARQDLADRGYIRPLVAVSEPPADSRPDEPDPTSEQPDETREDSPTIPQIDSPEVQKRANELREKDPNMGALEAEETAWGQLLEEQICESSD